MFFSFHLGSSSTFRTCTDVLGAVAGRLRRPHASPLTSPSTITFSNTSIGISTRRPILTDRIHPRATYNRMGTELSLRSFAASFTPAASGFASRGRRVSDARLTSTLNRLRNLFLTRLAFLGRINRVISRFSQGEKMQEIKQSRALATRKRILSAAARLFALKGYHDTKLEEVLGRAQVTTGAFFHHFNGKEDLGFAVIDSHMENRRRQLQRIEKQRRRSRHDDDPLHRLLRRLDAIQVMVRQREKRKGGCIIGNLSTALSDTHEAFRRRLADCFDEMALEFKPYLDAAVEKHRPRRRVDTWALARYILGIVEGSIMLARTRRDGQLMARNFDYAKEHLKWFLRA